MKKLMSILCVYTVLITGCCMQPESIPAEANISSTEEIQLPDGLYFPLEKLPKIESFSDNHYDSVANVLPEIIGAQYYSNGAVKALPNNDNRIYRLLNFIAASIEDGTAGTEYRYIPENEILSWYDDTSPMLEITFDVPKGESLVGLSRTSKMLIRQNSLLQVIDTNYTNGEVIANQFWPYISLWDDQTKPYSYEYLYTPEDGMQVWIDLLEYAGFYSD